ncbi:MAG: glycosyltransferase [Balneolales bacterium]
MDCSQFAPSSKTGDAISPIVLLALRMIRYKGINEFVEAAQQVRSEKPNVRFVLAGMSDDGNPNAVPVAQLEQWTKDGVVEWWGRCENMIEVIQNASIVTLPTFYPEGVHKVLIEAAEASKPLITTDRRSCREIVRDGVNGTLIRLKTAGPWPRLF